MENRAIERTFQVKLKGQRLENIENLAAARLRSVTKQIIRIIDEFVENNIEEAKRIEPFQ